MLLQEPRKGGDRRGGQTNMETAFRWLLLAALVIPVVTWIVAVIVANRPK